MSRNSKIALQSNQEVNDAQVSIIQQDDNYMIDASTAFVYNDYDLFNLQLSIVGKDTCDQIEQYIEQLRQTTYNRFEIIKSTAEQLMKKICDAGGIEVSTTDLTSSDFQEAVMKAFWKTSDGAKAYMDSKEENELSVSNFYEELYQFREVLKTYGVSEDKVLSIVQRMSVGKQKFEQTFCDMASVQVSDMIISKFKTAYKKSHGVKEVPQKVLDSEDFINSCKKAQIEANKEVINIEEEAGKAIVDALVKLLDFLRSVGDFYKELIDKLNENSSLAEYENQLKELRSFGARSNFGSLSIRYRSITGYLHELSVLDALSKTGKYVTAEGIKGSDIATSDINKQLNEVLSENESKIGVSVKMHHTLHTVNDSTKFTDNMEGYEQLKAMIAETPELWKFLMANTVYFSERTRKVDNENIIFKIREQLWQLIAMKFVMGPLFVSSESNLQKLGGTGEFTTAQIINILNKKDTSFPMFLVSGSDTYFIVNVLDDILYKQDSINTELMYSDKNLGKKMKNKKDNFNELTKTIKIYYDEYSKSLRNNKNTDLSSDEILKRIRKASLNTQKDENSTLFNLYKAMRDLSYEFNTPDSVVEVISSNINLSYKGLSK